MMTRSVTVTLAVLFAVLLAPAADAAQTAPVVTRRERLVDGLRHEMFRVTLDDGAVARGNVVRVAHNGRLRVEPKHAGGSIPGVETTPNMAAEELRRGGLAAINAGFWLPAAGGKPHGVAATDRVVFSGPKTQWGRPGHRGTLAIRDDGSAIFSRLAGKLTLIRPDSATVAIDDLNYVPLATGTRDGELLAYTGEWDAPVQAPRGSTVVVVSKLTLPVLGTASATVKSARKTSGRIAIPAGGAVLVGYGRARARLAGIAGGDTVRIKVGIKPLDISRADWIASVDVLPGGPLIVRNARMTPPADWVAEGFSHQRHNGPRHPRTAIGVTRSGAMLLVTVDGRQAHSVGMTMWELAELMMDLGARHALSLDGGGSTTMTVLGKTRNRISDPVPRPVASALVVRYRPDLVVRDASLNACPAGRVPRPGFTDIGGSTHKATIACAAWYGITTGHTASTFAPSRPVTRAQLASFLARLIYYTATHPGDGRRGRALATGSGHRFTDVPVRSPHAKAIGQLAAAGIVAGGPGTLPDSSFGPRQQVSRAQMATLVARTVAYVRGAALPKGGNVFADDAGSTHQAAINRLAEAGIVQGKSPGLYAPRAPVRRSAMASFLQRTMDVLVAAGTTTPPG
jgi:hypothetical protein